MNAPEHCQNTLSASDEKSRRILVVDDEEVIRGLLKEMLGAAGYEVVTASGGRKAFIRFSMDHFDLVITDIVMPGMDGIELLKTLRHLDPDVPVIMLTGYPTGDAAARLVELGATGYITKPFEAKLMKSTVAKALEAADIR